MSAANAGRVTVLCEDLNTETSQAEGATNENVLPATEEACGSAETAAVGSVDMDLITIETCI